MKKYIVFAMAAMMLFGALSAKAEQGDDISRMLTEGKIQAAEEQNRIEDGSQFDLTEGKIAAAEQDLAEREAREIKAMLPQIQRTLNQINSISEDINSRLSERFSSDMDKGEVADGSAKIGTEVSTANELVRELNARIPTKAETTYVLKSLKEILGEVNAVNKSLQH